MKAYACTFICILILSGCRHRENKPATLNRLLVQISEKSLPAEKKLILASQADSLAVAYKQDSLHIVLQGKIADIYLDMNDNEMARQHFFLASELSREKKYTANEGVFLNNIGLIFDETAQSDSALKYYRAAASIFSRTKDSARYAESLNNMGIVYKNAGQYQEALKVAYEAAAILSSLNELQSLSDSYTTIGNTLKALSNWDEALDYHSKALSIRENLKDSVGIAGSLNNIGNIYRYKKQYDHALDYYQRSLQIKQLLNNSSGVAISLDNIAEVYLQTEDYQRAEAYFTRALDMRRQTGDKDGVITTMTRLSRLYLKLGKIPKAEQLSLEVQTLLSGLPYLNHRFDNARLLADIYQESGQYRMATKYALQSLGLKDSLLNYNLVQTISEMDAKYQAKEKDRDLAFANQIKTQQAERISLQNTFILALAGVVLLLAAVAYLTTKLGKQRKRAKEHTELLMSELNHRVKNNLQVISSILNLQMHATGDERQKSLLKGIRGRIQSMWVIHELLQQQSYTGKIEMKEFLVSLIGNLTNSFHEVSNHFEIEVDCESIFLKTDLAVQVGLIINEWISNILKHSVLTGNFALIRTSLEKCQHEYVLVVSDNCLPWSFATTRRPGGLGLHLIETLVKQLKGNLTVTHGPADNTLTLRF
jgi:two-component sensor histidine kinase